MTASTEDGRVNFRFSSSVLSQASPSDATPQHHDNPVPSAIELAFVVVGPMCNIRYRTKDVPSLADDPFETTFSCV